MVILIWFQLVSEVSLPKNQNGAILEEIQLDFDQNELEQFFSDEAATTWQFRTVICYIFINFIKACSLIMWLKVVCLTTTRRWPTSQSEKTTIW